MQTPHKQFWHSFFSIVKGYCNNCFGGSTYLTIQYSTVINSCLLKSLPFSVQGGKVDKSIRSLAMSSTEAVHTENAIATLATIKGPELNQIATDDADSKNNNANEDAQDIAHEFLEQTEKQQPELPESNVFVYKGILKRLSGLCSYDVSHKFMAVLAGKDSSVYDVILAQSAAPALDTPEVMERWKDLGYEVLGLAVSGSMDVPDGFQSDIVRLRNPNTKSLLVLVFNGSSSPSSWVVHQQEGDNEKELCFSRVKIGRNRGRQKGDSFVVVHANKVGVTFHDEVGGHSSLFAFTFVHILSALLNILTDLQNISYTFQCSSHTIYYYHCIACAGLQLYKVQDNIVLYSTGYIKH